MRSNVPKQKGAAQILGLEARKHSPLQNIPKIGQTPDQEELQTFRKKEEVR
jgi:hypothetical protein